MSTEEVRQTSAFKEEEAQEKKIRPRALDEFIGQGQIKANLQVFLDAARARQEALDHVIFYGPPGLGKTTLSQIIAQELGVNIKITAGPILSKAGDLAAVLTNLQAGDVLFIDEIHRLPTTVEEVLYSAMEDFALDLVIGDGPAARSVRINLPKFTLVGATTRLGLLSGPLKDRFGIPFKLDFYTHDELCKIIMRGANVLDMAIELAAAQKLAQCSRGTPRVALRLLRRARDFAQSLRYEMINLPTAQHTLEALGVDERGLDLLDYKYLNYIKQFYQGGPVGIDTIAAGIAEDRQTIEDVIEPYLMQIGMLHRTPKGRVIMYSPSLL
jgi:Holliday junction DNA helicase RuvB